MVLHGVPWGENHQTFVTASFLQCILALVWIISSIFHLLNLVLSSFLPTYWSQLYSEKKIWRVWLVHQARKSHRFQGKIFLCHIMQHVNCSIIYIRSVLRRCWTPCTACLSTPTRTTTPFKSTLPPMSTLITCTTSNSSVSICRLPEARSLTHSISAHAHCTYLKIGFQLESNESKHGFLYRSVQIRRFVEYCRETKDTNKNKHKTVYLVELSRKHLWSDQKFETISIYRSIHSNGSVSWQVHLQWLHNALLQANAKQASYSLWFQQKWLYSV